MMLRDLLLGVGGMAAAFLMLCTVDRLRGGDSGSGCGETDCKSCEFAGRKDNEGEDCDEKAS